MSCAILSGPGDNYLVVMHGSGEVIWRLIQGHSIHRWWRHCVIITSILDRRITPYLGDLCFRKYSSLRIDEFGKLPYTCIKRKGKCIIHFKMYVYVIICVQLRQKHCNKTSRKFYFHFLLSYHLSWTWRIVKVAWK